MSTPFLQQRASAVSYGVRIIKKLLQRDKFQIPSFSPNAFTTTQLYRLAVKEPVPKGFLPYPLAPNELPVIKRKGPASSITPTEAFPPRPDHPIRSVKFLKRDILSKLEDARIIKLVRTPRPVAVVEESAKTKKQQKSSKFDFLWKVAGPADFPNPPKPKPVRVRFGTEVGVGLDISHLNKRRQRARVGKIRRDVLTMKELRRRPQSPNVSTTSSAEA